MQNSTNVSPAARITRCGHDRARRGPSSPPSSHPPPRAWRVPRPAPPGPACGSPMRTWRRSPPGPTPSAVEVAAVADVAQGSPDGAAQGSPALPPAAPRAARPRRTSPERPRPGSARPVSPRPGCPARRPSPPRPVRGSRGSRPPPAWRRSPPPARPAVPAAAAAGRRPSHPASSRPAPTPFGVVGPPAGRRPPGCARRGSVAPRPSDVLRRGRALRSALSRRGGCPSPPRPRPQPSADDGSPGRRPLPLAGGRAEDGDSRRSSQGSRAMTGQRYRGESARVMSPLCRGRERSGPGAARGS